MKIVYTRILARTETRQSIRLKYDQAHAALLRALDGVQDQEWHRGGNAVGEGFWTVEFAFREITLHFDAHVAQIRETLGREAG